MSLLPALCRQVAELALDSAPKPPFAPLPHDLVALIFRLLPVDTRLRCREVARGWRDALEDHRLWAELDLCSRMNEVRRTSRSRRLRRREL